MVFHHIGTPMSRATARTLRDEMYCLDKLSVELLGMAVIIEGVYMHTWVSDGVSARDSSAESTCAT